MTAIQITGVVAIFGALVYSVGDVLLLASKVNLDEYPKTQEVLEITFRYREDGCTLP